MSHNSIAQPRLTMAQREAIAGWLFVLPAVLGVLLWIAGPMLYSIWLSLTDWDVIRPPRYIGAENFIRMVGDRLFYKSLWVTVYYTIFHVPLTLILAFLVALLLNTKTRGIALFRTLYYLPSIVPAVANAVLWTWIFNSEFGLLNLFLNWLGFDKVLWLQNPNTALPALILMSLWSMGSVMIIYLAGLNGIPEQLYEAAEIDGASGMRKLFHITIPMMTPVIFFNLILQIIGSFQVFTVSYLMTAGGPNYATTFYVLYLFNNAFSYFDMGYASALAWVLFFIIMALSLVIFRSGSSWVYYEEER
ncbi:MAG TPA: sugar ABC transporter permease [Caldilineaceae bacterium]|nr:sugar ABC transporter permease [Caldilineaceae bacterium]